MFIFFCSRGRGFAFHFHISDRFLTLGISLNGAFLTFNLICGWGLYLFGYIGEEKKTDTIASLSVFLFGFCDWGKMRCSLECGLFVSMRGLSESISNLGLSTFCLFYCFLVFGRYIHLLLFLMSGGASGWGGVSFSFWARGKGGFFSFSFPFFR